MIFFKTVYLNTTDSEKVEKAIRKFTAKRLTFLDFQNTSHYVGGEDKVFIGLEKDNNIEITRLKSIHYSPKIILKFDKNTGFTEYKIRLGLVPFSILALLLVTFLLSIIYSVQDRKIDTDFSSIALTTGLFLVIIFREIILHHKRLTGIIHKIDSEAE